MTKRYECCTYGGCCAAQSFVHYPSSTDKDDLGDYCEGYLGAQKEAGENGLPLVVGNPVCPKCGHDFSDLQDFIDSGAYIPYYILGDDGSITEVGPSLAIAA